MSEPKFLEGWEAYAQSKSNAPRDAWDALIWEVAHALQIDRLLEWLEQKLNHGDPDHE